VKLKGRSWATVALKATVAVDGSEREWRSRTLTMSMSKQLSASLTALRSDLGPKRGPSNGSARRQTATQRHLRTCQANGVNIHGPRPDAAALRNADTRPPRCLTTDSPGTTAAHTDSAPVDLARQTPRRRRRHPVHQIRQPVHRRRPSHPGRPLPPMADRPRRASSCQPPDETATGVRSAPQPETASADAVSHWN
jgi:hypothetical protein